MLTECLLLNGNGTLNMRYCAVAGCRYPGSHLTVAHRCGTCNMYGHGQMECGKLNGLRNLARRIPAHITSVSAPCTVPDCVNTWSHTTEAHHCSACGSRGTTHTSTCPRNTLPLITRTCPSCKVTSSVDRNTRIFTGMDCIVCMESGPVVLFSSCKHANVCAVCVERL